MSKTRSKTSKNTSQKAQLMGHIIAGYPNLEASKYAALGICQAGAAYLEVQFPFSDPNADGSAIEEACNVSLQNGFKTKDGFTLVRELKNTLDSQKLRTKLIIMTYANVIFAYGVENFVKKAKDCGTWGIITPDLPPESDEGLRDFGKKYGINIISLIAPQTTPERIEKIAKISDEIVYVVARAGITGEKTQIDKALLERIRQVKKHCAKPLALGFGINSYEQVAQLEERVEIIVAGSYFVRHIASLSANATAPSQYAQSLKSHALGLMGLQALT